MQLKLIIKNITLLNILLISIVILFALYILFPMLDLRVKYTLPAAKKTIEKEEGIPLESQIPSITEYTKVVEENLFHPERKIPAEKKEEQPLPKPDFVLYGTMITDDMSLAYLEDLKAPRSTAGRGKRQISMKKGDILSGFTLKEIEAEKIVMVRGEEKMVVAMNDPSHPKVRVSTAPVTQAAPGHATAPSQATRAQQPSTAAPQRTMASEQPAVPPQPRATTQSAAQEKIQETKKFFDVFQKRPQR